MMNLKWTLALTLIGSALGILGGLGSTPSTLGITLGFGFVGTLYGAGAGLFIDILVWAKQKFTR